LQEFYLFFVFLQSWIETFFLACVFAVLVRSRKIAFLVIFLSLLTLLSFVRMADFVLIRLMDVSAWRWIELVAHETITNFIEMLYASNIKLVVWGTGLIGLLVAIVINTLVFFLTQKMCEKKPALCSFRKMTSYCLIGFILLGGLDVSFYLSQASNDSLAYIKVLPWKRTFLRSKEETWAVGGYLQTPQVLSLNSLDSTLFSLERKPDLFLFVVESLRADYLTEEVTPTLAQFRKESYCFENALSNANCTHKSWFSIFYSMYPFYWTKYAPKQWKQGGIPLSLLKKMGYQIHVYASSRLGYYGMDERLFGEKRHLVEELHEFRSSESLSPADTDQMAIQNLCKDLEDSPQKGGRIFIVFLDGTHFGYSWPKEKKASFLPMSEGLNYVEIIGKRRSVELIQNRYKNALSAIDDLFKEFQQTMVRLEMWEDAAVVFTADHGEEFNEFGCMFHASHLSLPQLHIPLYLKLDRGLMSNGLDLTRRASQIDIFPTLLHYLTGEDLGGSFFHGESLLSPPKKDYTIGARSNASLAPYEFYIQRGLYRATLEFCQKEDIFHSRSLKIRSIVDEKEEKVSFSPSFFQSQFGHVLEELFSLH
jgi:glucan phosphoethanolaminetransferase (alkaline phosphatase superfamily)